MITHLEPDILECEVKWAFESITTNKASWRGWNSSGAISNPERRCCASKFGKLNMPANLENSICQQIWKTQQCPQDWKRSVFIPIPKKGTAKDCSNYHKIVLISHASKVMLKFLQARLQQYMNFELPDIQVGFRKGRGNRDQIDNIR